MYFLGEPTKTATDIPNFQTLHEIEHKQTEQESKEDKLLTT